MPFSSPKLPSLRALEGLGCWLPPPSASSPTPAPSLVSAHSPPPLSAFGPLGREGALWKLGATRSDRRPPRAEPGPAENRGSTSPISPSDGSSVATRSMSPDLGYGRSESSSPATAEDEVEEDQLVSDEERERDDRGEERVGDEHGQKKKPVRACGPCKRHHTSCDHARPCARCTHRGHAERCIDVPSRRGNKLRLEAQRRFALADRIATYARGGGYFGPVPGMEFVQRTPDGALRPGAPYYHPQRTLAQVPHPLVYRNHGNGHPQSRAVRGVQLHEARVPQFRVQQPVQLTSQAYPNPQGCKGPLPPSPPLSNGPPRSSSSVSNASTSVVSYCAPELPPAWAAEEVKEGSYEAWARSKVPSWGPRGAGVRKEAYAAWDGGEPRFA